MKEESKFVLYAVALGMGVASVVLSVFSSNTVGVLLGIGMFCIAIDKIDSMEKKKKR